MDINADLDRTVYQDAEQFTWQPSPLAGVERVMLDRVGDEVAVATSIVRYAPGAAFSPHSHALGEEFVVLDGVFSDEHGDYPAGTYIRNPPGTSHIPSSAPGCVIWVKLRQFDDEDLSPLTANIPDFAECEVANSQLLHTYQTEAQLEEVSWVHVPAGQRYAFSSNVHVRELLILSGSLTWQQDVTRAT
ncbi:MAG: cupin [Pseudomonadales bacterium]|nr:cupin [Pseudomonadales bacterium]